MGSVWKAVHLTLGSPVAIKLIDDAIVNNPDVLARFEREAQAAANLRSPHVVQVLDYGVDEGTPFIAMELLDGESLEERLSRRGRLSVEETGRIMVHVARAIGKAHEGGITHRDLKPANIFLVRNEDDEVAKVLDFGIAKTEAPAGSATRTGHMIGTPAYMSPEQAQGTKSVDGRTDLWAMGVIACECLTGRMVFEGDAMGDLILQICAKPLPIPSQRGTVPDGFDEWFARALAREVGERFQSAKELVDSLRRVLGVHALGSTSGDYGGGTGPTLRGVGPMKEGGGGDEPAPASDRFVIRSGDDLGTAPPGAVESARTISSATVERPPPSRVMREAPPSTVGTFTMGEVELPTHRPRGLVFALAAVAVVALVAGLFFRSKKSDDAPSGQHAAPAVASAAPAVASALSATTTSPTARETATSPVASASEASTRVPPESSATAASGSPRGAVPKTPGPSVKVITAPSTGGRVPASGGGRPAAGEDRVGF